MSVPRSSLGWAALAAAMLGISGLALAADDGAEDTAPAPAVGPPAPRHDAPADARTFQAEPASYLCAERSLSLEALLREIDQRAKKVARQENTLEVLKAQVDETRASLRSEADRLEAAIAAYDEMQKRAKEAAERRKKHPTPEDRVRLIASEKRIAKAIKAMEAADAARLLENLDGNLAARLLQKMPPTQAGAALGNMKPNTAAHLATLAAKVELDVDPKANTAR